MAKPYDPDNRSFGLYLKKALVEELRTEAYARGMQIGPYMREILENRMPTNIDPDFADHIKRAFRTKSLVEIDIATRHWQAKRPDCTFVTRRGNGGYREWWHTVVYNKAGEFCGFVKGEY